MARRVRKRKLWLGDVVFPHARKKEKEMRPPSHALARQAAAAPARTRRPCLTRASTTPPPDVSRNVVRRAVRAPPLSQAAARPDLPDPAALCLAFVSESGYCRAPLAAAAARAALGRLRPPLSAPVVVCEALASRDYCAGRGPSPDAARAAARLNLADPLFSASTATPFLPATHAVRADLLAVVDRFVAADVLREVTVFDTVLAADTPAFGAKVRLLGGFAGRKVGENPGASSPSSSAVDALRAASAAGEGEDTDIDDPLYGNAGGPAQAAAVEAAAVACEAGAAGLVAWLAALDVEAMAAGIPLRTALSAALGAAGEIVWLMPPMLAPRG